MHVFITLLSLLSINSFQADIVDTSSVLQIEFSDKIEDRITFQAFKGWKYQPGDSIAWVSPEYDDSHWHLASSDFSSIRELPDHFEKGYGWWRMSFKADSAFYSKDWNLFFYTWGAAEVYLDGVLVHSAGNFALDQRDEILNSTLNKTYPPIKLENKTQVLAIRYSNHQAEFIENTFPGFGNYLGFNIGFSTHQYNESIISEYDNRQFIAVFSIAVLLVLILLHIRLYLKFSEDKSNLYVAVFFMICLTTVFFNFDATFYEPTLLQYNLANSAVVLCASLAIFMMPYLIASILRLDGYSRTKHLLWAAPFITLLHIKFGSTADFIQIGISVFSIGLTIKILLEAKRKNKFGLTYIASGGILPLIAICIYFLEKLGYITIHPTFLNMLGIVIFTIFPFALTLYIADRYGYLYSSLEKEVKKRTNELEEAYSDLQKSLEELKTTQNQLIQQEKLASLGQLTAGIAHEIKNPLNFVNNFSEVSLELVEEVREEVRRKTDDSGPESEKEGNPLSRGESEGKAGARGVSDKAGREDLPQYSETDSSSANTPLNPLSRGESKASPQMDLILDILNDIEANLRKIYEHGTRADSIVKSMLQHSRGGDGKMEPTALNPLIKEYVNLAFHGMRAGKNPINVDIDLQLDESVGEVPLIAEDFSRVILNLCSNAFDAMREKLTGDHGQMTDEKLHNSEFRILKSGAYTPKLTVRTHQKGSTVAIEIEDNGPGIPDEIKNKILQPFFTTKKGTEGTGLGLSITHDIVKAHGGSVNVESNNKKGAIFTIKLPT